MEVHTACHDIITQYTWWMYWNLYTRLQDGIMMVCTKLQWERIWNYCKIPYEITNCTKYVSDTLTLWISICQPGQNDQSPLLQQVSFSINNLSIRCTVVARFPSPEVILLCSLAYSSILEPMVYTMVIT